MFSFPRDKRGRKAAEVKHCAVTFVSKVDDQLENSDWRRWLDMALADFMSGWPWLEYLVWSSRAMPACFDSSGQNGGVRQGQQGKRTLLTKRWMPFGS